MDENEKRFEFIWDKFSPEFLNYIESLKDKVKIFHIDEKRIHYHFKKKKEMRQAMRLNWNLHDTFSYQGTLWERNVSPALLKYILDIDKNESDECIRNN